MNESLLKTLMQLFAIVANVTNDSISEKSRYIVTSYLTNFLPKNLVEYYLTLFDEYLKQHHSEIRKTTSRDSLHGIRILKYCQKINEQLIQSQKHVVLIELLEFIRNGEQITEKELDFSSTIANVFKIDDEEYNHCKSFVLETEIPLHDCLLIADSNPSQPDPRVKHIHLEGLNGQIFVLYIKSTNLFFFRYIGKGNVYLNNQVVRSNRTYTLDAGASVSSGKIKTIYYQEIAEQLLETSSYPHFSYTAENVGFHYPHSDSGVIDFNFHERSGSMIGILGPSGTGKSTLINLMSGKLKPQKGKILVNNENIHSENLKDKTIIGYVPQDDLLIEELTVYQNLYYNAQLCFGNLSGMEVHKRVITILKDLDLYEIHNLKVGNSLNKLISGGERKRLNMALELIREPCILFVDEPTSGLSSSDSQLVMDLLKKISLKGKLVVTTIHQPGSDIYKLFDRIIVLDRGGYTIYYGNPIEAISYFKVISQQANFASIQCESCGNLNPETVLHTIDAKVVDEYGRLTHHRKISPREWHDLYLSHKTYVPRSYFTDEIPESEIKKAGKIRQARIYFTRDFKAKISNIQYILINLLEAPVLAFIIGYFLKYFSTGNNGAQQYIFAYNENIPVYLFLSVIVALFMGLSISVEEIIRDKKLLEREAYLKLNKSCYFFSKIMLLFFISSIQTFLFVLVANNILEIKDMFFDYWAVLFSAAAFCNMLGLIISSSLKSVIAAYVSIPLVLIPQIMFCGVVVDYDKLHKSISSPGYVPVIGELMISRWAYEALAVNQFKSNKYEKRFFETDRQLSRYSYLFNYLIPELKLRLQECDSNLIHYRNINTTDHNIQLIENEIRRLEKKYQASEKRPVEFVSVLEKNKSFTKYLNELEKYAVQRYSLLLGRKEAEIKNESGKTDISGLKLKYHNEHLADIVLNSFCDKRIDEDEESFIQKIHPIFKDNDQALFRSHFYASEKKLPGLKAGTFWYNLLVIWTGVFVLYFFLYFNMIKVFGKFLMKIKKKSKYE